MREYNFPAHCAKWCAQVEVPNLFELAHFRGNKSSPSTLPVSALLILPPIQKIILREILRTAFLLASTISYSKVITTVGENGAH